MTDTRDDSFALAYLREQPCTCSPDEPCRRCHAVVEPEAPDK